jgi:hypothetical protein
MNFYLDWKTGSLLPHLDGSIAIYTLYLTDRGFRSKRFHSGSNERPREALFFADQYLIDFIPIDIYYFYYISRIVKLIAKLRDFSNIVKNKSRNS